jgi:hypothetical protein
MNKLTATTLEMLRNNPTVELFNTVFSQAIANDNKIEEALAGPECIDVDSVDNMVAKGETINTCLTHIAAELKRDFAFAGIQVESEWGQGGDWAMFLNPQMTYSRQTQFLITSLETFGR